MILRTHVGFERDQERAQALRKHGVTAPIDVHLMVSPVDRIVGDFAAAGATYITFHPEARPTRVSHPRCVWRV